FWAATSLAQEKAIVQSFEEISQKLYEMRKDYVASGSYIVIAQNGQVIYKSMNGLADVEHQVPVSDSTIFDLASLAKMFTGYAIAQLEVEGLLAPDEDIHKYLPDFPDYGHKITIAHLLHHTSGVKNWTTLLRRMGWTFDNQVSFEQLIRLTYAQTELDFKPGERYQYSNSGYNLLVKIIEKATGQSFVDWTQENIFKPLAMDQSFFNDQPNRIIPHAARGYFLNNQRKQVRAFNNLTGLGSSSLYSNGSDMVKWMNFLLNPPSHKQKFVDRMLSTQKLNNGEMNTYAYGIEMQEYKGLKFIHHSGSWGSQTTHLVLLPEKNAALFLAHNFRTNTRRIINSYVDAFLPPEPKKDENKTAPPVQTAKKITLRPDQLDAYLGSYQLEKAWFITISRIGDQLFTTANGEPTLPMQAIND
ncbi:MAG: serine hydrolase, partial [Bacteroidota bacterium]